MQPPPPPKLTLTPTPPHSARLNPPHGRMRWLVMLCCQRGKEIRRLQRLSLSCSRSMPGATAHHAHPIGCGLGRARAKLIARPSRGAQRNRRLSTCRKHNHDTRVDGVEALAQPSPRRGAARCSAEKTARYFTQTTGGANRNRNGSCRQ